MRGIVPHPMLVAIGVKNDGPLAELRFQTIGIQFRLLLTNACVALGLLGFNKSERFSVVPPEHVIDETFLRTVWHASDGKLAVACIGECPARFFQEQVDEVISRLR